MIGKARAIAHTRNALKYPLTKKDAVSITSNLLSSADDSNRIALEMKRVQELNSRCTNNCLRIEVSPAREDTLLWGNKQWEQLANEVVDRVGLNDRQYVAVLHKDTDNPHLHIVANRIDFEGEALNDSFISYKLGLITEQISRDNGLTIANEVQKKKKYEKKIRKED